MALVAYEGSDEDLSEDEVEKETASDSINQAAKEGVAPKRPATNAPKLPDEPKSKIKKIELPRLTQNADVDDDLKIGKLPPALQTKKTSGLFGQLPAPKHSVIFNKSAETPVPRVEAIPRPSLDFPFRGIPINAVPKQDLSSLGNGEAESPTRTLSSAKKEETKATSGLMMPTSVLRKPVQNSRMAFSLDTGMPQSSLASKKTKVAADLKEPEPTEDQNEEMKDFFSLGEVNDESDSDDVPVTNELTGQDEPLQFTSTSMSSWGHSVHPTHVPVSYPQYEAMAEDLADDEVAAPLDVSSILADEEFRKIQGKKNRSLEEINIIDVRQDDQIRDVDINKGLSEEMPSVSFAKKKEGQPSGQQKRKHQITYLAHQAKQRELDLKNQWAQNRSTKRETQSKYGF